MKLKFNSFKSMEQKSIKVSQIKTMDLKTGTKAIAEIDSNIAEMLTNCIEVLKEIRKNNKESLSNAGKTEKPYIICKLIEDYYNNLECDSVEQKNKNDMEKVITLEIALEGEKNFTVNYLDVHELIFVPEMSENEEITVNLVYSQYSKIQGISDSEKYKKLTFLTSFTFKEGQTFFNLDESTIKNSLGKDIDGKKLEKLNRIFDIEPNLLDTNNINTVIADREKAIDTQCNDIVNQIKSKIKAHVILKNL